MNIVCLICARGNSKGLKNKNIKNFNGIPLIARTIIQAKEIKKFNKIIVSTESKKIRNIAQNYGAETPFLRPKFLSLDETSEIEVWRHAIKYLTDKKEKIDLLVCLPCTSPLRKKSDIYRAIDTFNNSICDVVVGVTESNKNPYFTIVNKNIKNEIKLFSNVKKNIFRRQDAPKTYDIAPNFFIVKPSFLLNKKNIKYMDGRVKSVIINKVNSFDIDDKFDFKLAEIIDKNIKYLKNK